jgi:hypothetical protein
MIDLVQTKVRQHFSNFLNRLSKSYDFLRWDALDVIEIHLICPEFAAWRRQIFVRVAVLILFLFTTVKEFTDFSHPYRSSTQQILSMLLFRFSENSARSYAVSNYN